MKSVKIFCSILLVFFAVKLAAVQFVIVEPDDGVVDIVKILNHAKKKIDISIYNIADYNGDMDNEVLNSLIAARKRGVKVKVILNNFNNDREPRSGKKYLKLEKKWCDSNNIKYVLSTPKFRYTHNKYILLDDKVAMLMSCNLNSQSLPPKGRERNFILVDDTKKNVDYLNKLFEADWKNANKKTNKTPKSKPENLLINPNDGYSVRRITGEIDKADKILNIYMMYFDESAPGEITKAINAAVKRGVQTKIICSSVQKKYIINKKFGKKRKGKYIFPDNLQIIIQKENSSLPFIHAKVFIIDTKTVIIGSLNMSYTSCYLNREVDIIVKDKRIVLKVQNTFNADWRKSKPGIQVN